MPEKDKRPLFSFSNEKFMLGCLEDKYFLHLWQLIHAKCLSQ